MKIKYLLLLSVVTFFLTGCLTPAEHYNRLPNQSGEEFTVGTVQARINKGMSQTEVIEALGSPNIVTRDREETESWVYDKIASEASYSRDSGSLLLLYNREAGVSRTTKKTLTVVIKFDQNRRVKSYSYHSSKF